MNLTAAPSPRAGAKLSTEAAARRLAVKPQTLRASFCRHGHYFQLVPVKLPSRRLLWDEAAVDRLIAGEVTA
ncbi:MAG: hypothetical protein ABTS16_13125 [Candidatus Accumulibacter phosphatis]|jgi:hypothetical protein|uniref:DNA-binding protein n=1 Tax=Candidatus Accumulibacter phosphatis TaxID=327160 RepID=A0A084Y714_9PROT|nr:MAG: hypothetical protein AW09_004401 [Candidatus Accumulibacter phosphatis]MBL8406200.1 hypothetical protein [Accumulibacter sp.]